MKKINIDEEFAVNGTKFMFTKNDTGRMVLKNLGTTRGGKKDFEPPTKQEVMDYFAEKGYTSLAAEKFFDYYEAGNWKDSKGTQVKNWRQKAMAVWFRPDNEIKKPVSVIEEDNKGFLF